MDIKKILRASLFAIGIGILLVIISVILQILSFLLTDYSIADRIAFVTTVYAYLMFPFFLLLYFWTGMRSVNKYKLDAVGAGVVAAFSYIVTGLMHIVFNSVMNLLVVGGVFHVTVFRSTESVVVAAILGNLVGGVGVLASSICGLGLLVFGMMINFVVGAVGGLFAQRE